mmetsp:Transcript_27838/g.47048  ORF Transcript_27838/g.47048 Transcript_27838/m.47048 type:complete len:97 (-) Transcript_27838:53-343(-)
MKFESFKILHFFLPNSAKTCCIAIDRVLSYVSMHIITSVLEFCVFHFPGIFPFSTDSTFDPASVQWCRLNLNSNFVFNEVFKIKLFPVIVTVITCF